MDAELATSSIETSEDECGNASTGGISDIEDAEELRLNTAPPEFYDPDADDRDERWVAKQRKGHKSDAVLSCPLCFTTLCVDCQQHARYENQFRAMFVMNCRVITKQLVRVPSKPSRARRRHSQQETRQHHDGGVNQLQAGESMQDEGLHVSQQQQQGGGQSLELGQQHLHRQAGQTRARDAGEGDALHPVQCAVCDTEVGLQEASGVFHFFNVFASNA